MTDATAANMESQQQQHRRMSAPAAYALAPADTTDCAVPSVPRRSSLVGAPPPTTTTTDLNPQDPRPASTQDDGETREGESMDSGTAARKRAEQRAETMFSMDEIFSRDLRITGVSKKGASWRYHIDVLDIRNSLMPFTESFTSTASTAASSPASSSVASVPPPSSSAYTLPPLVRYSVMRRYNDFRQLYQYLVDYFGPELLDALPKFPDGGLVSYFRGDDPKLLQYRKEQLQKFLRALDDHDDTKWSRAFRLFLNPEIDELSSIGGESFASLVENYGSSRAGAAAPLSSSASASYWEGVALSRINTNSGYVSLSHVKSPEIRFKKQPTDARGDWKRRKIARANRGEEPEDGAVVKRPRRVKRLELDEPHTPDNQSDTGDDEDDDDEDDDGESPKKSSTELMKLLSLEPVADRTTNQ